MIVTMDNILKVYDEVNKNTKNKKKVYYFEKNKMINCCEIYDKLNTFYDGGVYNVFLVKEPKYRIVMSQNMQDKLINHYFARYCLIPKLDKYLDIRNIATRKGMGIDYGIKLLKKYLEMFKKYDVFYILKLDISKYFYNIDHDVLKSMLKDKLSNDEYLFISTIIDSTNNININKKIKRIKEKEILFSKRKDEVSRIPLYKYNKGLSIGAMTSQFLSIFYLNGLDHKIVNDYKIKHYIRFMDDFILIHNDKEYLKKVFLDIKYILKEQYKLELNKNKSFIVSSKTGFEFLGYFFKVVNNKTLIKVKTQTIKRIKNKIKTTSYLYKNNKISFQKYFSIYNTYRYGFKYGNRSRVIRVLNENNEV